MAWINFYREVPGDWADSLDAVRKAFKYRQNKNKQIVGYYCRDRVGPSGDTQWRPIYVIKPNYFFMKARPVEDR